jgi:hypothetical protein
MLIWTDAEGRKWSTRLEIPRARELRDLGYDVRDHERLTQVLGDPEQLLDFAVEFFRPQWSAHSDVMDEFAFMVALTATDTTLIDAHSALVAGLTDFFRRCGDAKRVAVLEKLVAAIARETEAMVAKIDSPEVDDAIEASIRQRGEAIDNALAKAVRSGETSTKPAENAESSPTA